MEELKSKQELLKMNGTELGIYLQEYCNSQIDAGIKKLTESILRLKEDLEEARRQQNSGGFDGGKDVHTHEEYMDDSFDDTLSTVLAEGRKMMAMGSGSIFITPIHTVYGTGYLASLENYNYKADDLMNIVNNAGNRENKLMALPVYIKKAIMKTEDETYSAEILAYKEELDQKKAELILIMPQQDAVRDYGYVFPINNRGYNGILSCGIVATSPGDMANGIAYIENMFPTTLCLPMKGVKPIIEAAEGNMEETFYSITNELYENGFHFTKDCTSLHGWHKHPIYFLLMQSGPETDSYAGMMVTNAMYVLGRTTSIDEAVDFIKKINKI